MSDVSDLGRPLGAVRLEHLALSWRGCVSCGLSLSRTQVVFYRGSPNASLVVVGDAPGLDDDLQGRPFAGMIGRVLDGLFAEAKIVSDDIGYLHMVGCRAPSYRLPLASELKACAPRTLDMIKTVDPAVLLLLGKTAASLAKVTSIGPWRGMPITCEIAGKLRCAIVSYHPAYLLRQPGENMRKQMIFDFRVAFALARKDAEP
jgi:DNA polymerase